jgi:hypothetical protein
MSTYDLHHDWLRLIDITGPFLAVPVLKETFPTGLEGLDGLKRKRLRQTYDEWREALETGDPQISELHAAWIDEVLSRGLELDADRRVSVLKRADWCAASLKIDLAEHAISMSPDMAVVDELRSNKPLMLVQIFSQDTDLDASQKLEGWIATPAERMVQLCRASGCRLGLLTNGERWMLIDAPVGAVSSFASWYARIWTQEPVTLQAFVHLLGIRRFFCEESEQLPALLDRSLKYQDEVTEALGEQVRRAVEVLIQALDKADQDRNRELLFDVTEPELYEAALTVMMRLVFLLAAEERGLLLMGDESYEANYAVSTLRMQLTAESDGVLERRWDAWSRLLAIFRIVYGGVEHENLRLPALGGSLFDPDRFPFLEGRAKGSKWFIDMAKPLPIDNRTVLLLLRAIQQFQGRTLSYAGLDVEQVGHVYEGLLERTVKRTTEVTLEFDGTKNAKAPWIKVTELESAAVQGADRLAELLEDRSGSSASRIRNDLAKPVDDILAGRLLAACHGDAELRDRIQRYAHLVRTDPWGYPLVYPAGSFIVTTGSDRRETGAHYTPKSLTEAIVIETLTPVVYVGPAEGKPRDQWALKSPSEILDLKVCDPAMGSGAFLVQVCRWLAERLVEAWSLAETTGRVVSVDGTVLDAANGKELLPRDIDARTMIARRLIAERCLYGVDLNPLAVELAKLSIWLVTLAKGRPFGFLDHNLRNGDSLLGIKRLDQLFEITMTPGGKGQQNLFGENIAKAVQEAIELRYRIRQLPIRDIRDVEVVASLDADARRQLSVPVRIADALAGQAFVNCGNATALDIALKTLTIQASEAVQGDLVAMREIDESANKNLSTDLSAGKGGRKPFHWPIEFPEVFSRRESGFNAVVGNPPFLGGKKISSSLGYYYERSLKSLFNAKGAGDLCCYFFRVSFDLCAAQGAIGLLATNSISEGDSPSIGIRPIIDSGGSIYTAYSSFEWPGAANIYVARLCIFKGAYHGEVQLNSHQAKQINSMLLEESDEMPKKLNKKLCICSAGRQLYGQGFILDENERAILLSQDSASSDVIRPYFNADQLGKTSNYEPTTWAIDFRNLEEADARRYPAAFSHLERTVKPIRAKITKQVHESRFWLYWDKRPNFFESIKNLNRILVCPRVSKHLAFHFAQQEWVITEAVQIFGSASIEHFGLLQSSVHESWARKYSSTLGEGLRYSTSDCFDTFPVPDDLMAISQPAQDYYSLRQEIMTFKSIGTTALYNLFHSHAEASEQITQFRKLHIQLDQACLSAFGWTDIILDHSFRSAAHVSSSNEIRFTISEAARVELLHRLAELNRQRYQEEVDQGLHDVSAARAKNTPRPKVVGAATHPMLDFGDTAANHGQSPKAPEPHRPYASPATAILDFLSTRAGWHAKADILGLTGLADGQWSAAIADLISGGKVERQGEKRGTRYRAVGADK